MIFLIQECVCHSEICSRRRTGLFPAEKEISAGLTPISMVLSFIGNRTFTEWDTLGDNCLKQAQPAEANHQFARGMVTAIRRCQWPARFRRLPRRSGAPCIVYVSSAAVGISA